MALRLMTEAPFDLVRWGHLVRRDVYLRMEGGPCVTEAREGGTGGAMQAWFSPTEQDALLLVDDLLSDQDGWRELTVRP
ncbi:hypothetical protein [Plantactinospora soyae]|uniref:Uncharacterized protein n=1 Tax=Plantactinospora soyae TaxID=1544732 RepID=A0A927R775_9ACTN|nr:hypothetical protein [Plantactinospora soyae]MBE1489164.1 hypothetical protein [Plantactinospora soyae]